MSNISVSGVTKTFELNERTITAVNDVSLKIEEGNFISVVGPSGCGKSTLLHIIGDLLKPDKGEVSFNRGEGRCGFVFQEPRLLNSRTVRDNLKLAMKHIKTNSEKNSLLGETLSTLEILEFIDAYPNQLSGGMAQRVALGRALCRQPDVLLMDEPFSALDAFLRKKLQEELMNLYLKRRLTIVFVTHDVLEAVYLGKQVVIMNEGRIIKKVDVDLEYPRNRSSLEFIRLSDSILETIGNFRVL